MASVAYWVCEVRDGRIVFWESFSDRRRALMAAGLEPSSWLLKREASETEPPPPPIEAEPDLETAREARG